MAATHRAMLATAFVVAAGIAISGCSAMPPPSEETSEEVGVSATAQARSFLDDWVDDDGRVVRRDQGGDTVSEGQAYGLLAAVVADDESAFGAIWRWTEDELMRDDGLLAWRWADGAVVDDEPASDAELDAARALVLAGERFGRDDLDADGVALADGILDRLTIQTALGRVMLPGLWAADRDAVPYNPSYASPAAFAVLGERTGDPRWTELAAGSDAATTALLAAADLPPDWAQIQPDGTISPLPGPLGEGPEVQYGFDAQRVMLRYAEACDPQQRAIVGAALPALSYADEPVGRLDLGGGALGEDRSPLSIVARAGVAVAAGDTDAARADVELAARVSEEFPTYYGRAWVMLGSAMLGGHLGGCGAEETS